MRYRIVTYKRKQNSTLYMDLETAENVRSEIETENPEDIFMIEDEEGNLVVTESDFAAIEITLQNSKGDKT